MRSNRPQAKFCLKSDSNHLLSDFFDPISAAQFTRRDDLIRIQTRIRLKSSILYRFNQKWLILIEIKSFSTIFHIN